MAPATDPAVKLTSQTWVPIGAAVAAMGAVATAAVWINANIQELRYSNRGLAEGLNRVEAKVMELSDRWTGRDMAQWVELLRAKNKALEIPDVPR